MRLHFQAGHEPVVFTIDGREIFYTQKSLGLLDFPIEKILSNPKFINRDWMEREFPELKDLPNEEFKKACVLRWKEKMREFSTENNIKNYIILEMEKQGLKFLGRRCDETKK